jgi:ABC-type multidrug transport system fused ATPase/permease subunit
MEEKRFRVIFTGEILPGRDPAQVRRKLVEARGLSPEKAQLIFSGKKVILKEGADRDTAMQIKNAFLSAGALCRIEEQGKPTEPGPEPKQAVSLQKAELPPEDDGADPKTPDEPQEQEEEGPLPGPSPGSLARRALDFAAGAVRGRGRTGGPEDDPDFRMFQAMLTGGLVTGLLTLIAVARWAIPQAALILGLSTAKTLAGMAIFLAIVFFGVRFGWKVLLAAAVMGAFLVQMITGNKLSLPGLTVLMAVFPGILLLCTIAGALPGAAAGYLVWEADQKSRNPPPPPGEDRQ